MFRIFIGIFIVIIGLSALTGLSLLKFAVALLLIAIGVRIIVGHGNKMRFTPSSSNENELNEVAIFSPVRKQVRSGDFRGGSMVLVFSGGEIDLSEAQTSAPEVMLEITAIFGGCKLIVPKSWRVYSEGTAILGGYHVSGEAGSGTMTLRIRGAAIFGGVEIVQ
jgi:predicted membrane protein